MKKLVLKKEIVTRLTHDAMNSLRGGGNYTSDTYITMDNTCALNTCELTCANTCANTSNDTCNDTCAYSCGCPQTNILGDCLTQDYEICRTKRI